MQGHDVVMFAIPVETIKQICITTEGAPAAEVINTMILQQARINKLESALDAVLSHGLENSPCPPNAPSCATHTEDHPNGPADCRKCWEHWRANV